MAKQPEITPEELKSLYRVPSAPEGGEDRKKCWRYVFTRSNTDGSERPKKVTFNGELMPPHQAVYELLTDSRLPDDRWLAEKCPTPYCGNPRHYEEETWEERQDRTGKTKWVE